MKNIQACVSSALLATLSLAGCAQMGGGNSAKPDQSSTAPAQKKTGPGMDANGVVVDPTKVEAGYGQSVKGLGDWDGEITGVASPGSPFSRLQIGMPLRQVVDIAGRPTDEGSYITGKAFIPFYFGSDRYRYELAYKGQGRLIFAGGASGDHSDGHLIWIINSAADTGYR